MPGLLNRVTSKSTVSGKEHKCTVQLLDDTQTMTVDFKKHDIGQVVLDYVCDMLNIVEKDYFGLRFVDTNRHRYWLDATKPILRQVKSSSIVFAFRVKFYPSDPTIVKEELTRYMIATQLKRDLLHGRLYCPQSDAAVLGAYILQGDIGDYDPQDHAPGYVSAYKLFLTQTPKLEEKIAVEHQKLKGKGLTPADADLQFLKKACRLDTYGYYPYTIKDPKHGQVYMGATPHGVLVYQTHRKLHHIKWDDVKDFDYVGKDFFIYTIPEYFVENNIEADFGDQQQQVEEDDENGTNGDQQNHLEQQQQQNQNQHNNKNGDFLDQQNSKNGKKAALRFNCPSSTFSKHLWKYMLAQQAFFTKQRSTEVKPVAIRRGLLFRRATFRYSGRVLQEIKEAPSPRRAEPSFERVHLQAQMHRDDRAAPWANKFHTLPRATKPDSKEGPASKDRPFEAPEQQQHHKVTVNTTLPVGAVNTGGRDSLLLLDTTAQATPDASPLSGLSPAASASTARAETSIDSTTLPTSPAASQQQQQNPVSLKQLESNLLDHHDDHHTPQSQSQSSGDKQWTNGPPSGGATPPTGTGAGVVRRGIVRLKDDSPNHSQQQQPPVVVVGSSAANNSKNGVTSSTKATTTGSTTKQQPNRAGGGGVCRVLVKTILGGLVFTVLVIGTVILIMEIDHPQFRQYVRDYAPAVEDPFRHQYYQPTRQRALDWYQTQRQAYFPQQ